MATLPNADQQARDDLSMTEAKCQALAWEAFAIENYHRALKQYCAIEKCKARFVVAQKNHILFSHEIFKILMRNKRLYPSGELAPKCAFTIPLHAPNGVGWTDLSRRIALFG